MKDAMTQGGNDKSRQGLLHFISQHTQSTIIMELSVKLQKYADILKKDKKNEGATPIEDLVSRKEAEFTKRIATLDVDIIDSRSELNKAIISYASPEEIYAMYNKLCLKERERETMEKMAEKLF